MNGITVLSNFLWRFAERVGAQGVKLLVELILARILMPEEYGIIALVTVFITILNVFVDSGLGNALIQKKEADDLDFSSVFWFNVVWCLILYGVLYFASPLIASFYRKNELILVLRVLGLQVIISGVKNVYQAYVSRNMQFRKFFFSTLGGTIGAAIIGITMAYRGYGVWALVAQHLFNMLVDTIILCFTVHWHPKRQFSFSRLKGLLNYGWKLLVSSLLDTVYNEVQALIIGKVYSSSDLAFYNRGLLFPQVIASNVNTSIDSVLLPSMSKEQDTRTRVKAMTRRAIMTSTYILAPLMIGMAFISEPMIKLLLTEKWLPCVPFLRVFCIALLFFPIHTANLNAIKAMGRSDLFLKLEVMKKIVGIITILVTMQISVMAMAIGVLVSSVLGQIINSWPNRKLLDYRYVDQLKDIFPNLFMAIVMGLLIYPMKYIPVPEALVIFFQLAAGMCIYLFLSKITHNETLKYLLGLVKSHMNKKQDLKAE